MHVARTIAELRECVHDWRAAGERIAFVPTMGNLHAGHLDLVVQAQARAQRVVVSIFVNPTQFGPNEDFARYPRTEIEDETKLARQGVDLLFLPQVEEMYPGGTTATTFVEVPGVSDGLCGAHRPGHFRGVATVVARLFNIVQPDIALFGEKDFQQLLVIRRMARDLAFPVEIVGVATTREADGLALSSRNQYLDDAQRQVAPLLQQVLSAAAGRLRKGERDIDAVERDAVRQLEIAGFATEYVEVRNAEDLGPVEPGKPKIILAAARLGTTRLIDNLRI